MVFQYNRGANQRTQIFVLKLHVTTIDTSSRISSSTSQFPPIIIVNNLSVQALLITIPYGQIHMLNRFAFPFFYFERFPSSGL